MTMGLRERRKRETRRQISDLATQMFLDRGFEAVTISEVAQAAGVAKMTVTNYFPRKEDLVFDRAQAIIESLATAVAARRPGESMLAAVRRDWAQAAARGDVTIGLSSPEFAAMIICSPVLASRGLEIQEQRELALGDAIAAEAGRDGPPERLVAALLAAVPRVLYAEGFRRSRVGEPRPEIIAALAAAAEDAFRLLEPAIGSYGIRGDGPEPGTAGGGAAGAG